MTGNVDEGLKRILDSLPPDQPRSRLEPFREYILRWRRQGRSFERIRSILKDECNISVALSTLHEFTAKRSRPRTPQPESEGEMSATTSVADRPPLKTPRLTATPSSSTASTDPYAEVRERMRRHKEEPVPSKPKPFFEIPEEDFIKPLQMMQRPPKEK
jgi:hypothetical protein